MDGGAWEAAVHGVTKSRIWLSDFTFTFHFHALEKEMSTHSSVLAWRIPGTGETGGLLSMGSHKVRHDWSNLAAAAAASIWRDKGQAWGTMSIQEDLNITQHEQHILGCKKRLTIEQVELLTLECPQPHLCLLVARTVQQRWVQEEWLAAGVGRTLPSCSGVRQWEHFLPLWYLDSNQA